MYPLDGVTSSAQMSTAAGSISSGPKGPQLSGPAQVFAQAVPQGSIANRLASFRPGPAASLDEHKGQGGKTVTQRVDFFTRLQTQKPADHLTKRNRGPDQSHAGLGPVAESVSSVPPNAGESALKRTRFQERIAQLQNPSGAGTVLGMATAAVHFPNGKAVVLPRMQPESSASGQSHAGPGAISHRVSTFPSLAQMKKASEAVPMDESSTSGPNQTGAGSISHRTSAFPQLPQASKSSDAAPKEKEVRAPSLISHRVSAFPPPAQMVAAPKEKELRVPSLISHRVSAFPPPAHMVAAPKDKDAQGPGQTGPALVSHRVSIVAQSAHMSKAPGAASKEKDAQGPALASHRASVVVPPAHMSKATEPALKEPGADQRPPSKGSLAHRLASFPHRAVDKTAVPAINGTQDQS